MDDGMLTEEEYVRKSGLICPVCLSDQIEGSTIEIDDGYAWQNVNCTDCKSTWKDTYTLHDYDNLEIGDIDASMQLRLAVKRSTEREARKGESK